MPTTAAYTLVPSSLNSESYDVVSHDGTILGAITRDVCNGRVLRGAYTLAPDVEGAGFAGRYGSLEEAADAIAATWPTEDTPAQADTTTEENPVTAEQPDPDSCSYSLRVRIDGGSCIHAACTDLWWIGSVTACGINLDDTESSGCPGETVTCRRCLSVINGCTGGRCA